MNDPLNIPHADAKPSRVRLTIPKVKVSDKVAGVSVCVLLFYLVPLALALYFVMVGTAARAAHWMTQGFAW